MGFPVTVVLGASGRIGRVLRHCWRQDLPQSPQSARLNPPLDQDRQAQETLPPPQIRWQSRSQLAPGSETETTCQLDPLADPAGLAQLMHGADLVLCLAGSIPGRGGDLADNSRLALASLEAAARAAETTGAPAARVLLSSSAAVYGNQSGLLSEASPLHPANAYGAAKMEMERQALARGQQLGVPVTALRIGNIAGLDAILGGWKPGFCLDQFADHRSPRRSYIGPKTLAQTLARLLATPGACPDLPQVLNLAQPRALEMAALLRASDLPFAWRPAPQTAIAEVELDLSRLQHVLQGSPLSQDWHGGALEPAEAGQMLAEWAEIEPVLTGNPQRLTDPSQRDRPVRNPMQNHTKNKEPHS